MNESFSELERLQKDGKWVECAIAGEILAETARYAEDYELSGNALFICGFARGMLDDLDGAAQAYEQALAIGFRKKGVIFNLANTYRSLGKSLEALKYYNEILRLDPDNGAALSNLAFTWEDLGDLDKAEYYFKEGAEKHSSHIDSVRNYGYTLLRQGNRIEGWKRYETRGNKNKLVDIDINYKHGTDLRNKKILIGIEQGVGDTIMFGGLVQEIAGKADTITVLCCQRLASVLKWSMPYANVITTIEKKDLNSFDLRIGIASLGIECRNANGEMKAVKPYLRVPQKVESRIKQKLSHLDRDNLIVGLAWKGGGSDKRNHSRRSMRLKDLAELLQINGISWINMQYGEVEAEIEDIQNELGIKIHTVIDPTNDFEGLTACLAQVDMVVTVQQSLVHFSGACGTKTEALIPYIPEWRYGTKGARMEWWNSVRLRRQKIAGDWSKPIEEVRRVLTEMAIRKRQ